MLLDLFSVKSLYAGFHDDGQPANHSIPTPGSQIRFESAPFQMTRELLSATLRSLLASVSFILLRWIFLSLVSRLCTDGVCSFPPGGAFTASPRQNISSSLTLPVSLWRPESFHQWILTNVSFRLLCVVLSFFSSFIYVHSLLPPSLPPSLSLSTTLSWWFWTENQY